VLNLLDILEALTGVRPQSPSLVISEAAVDSRQVIPGGLFVALPGENQDGHEFIRDAFSRGANIAIIQRDVSKDLKQIDLRKQGTKLSLPLEPPYCLRVDDSLNALQKIAGFWRSKQDIRVIGITGSVGKSTTKELITEVLSQRYRTLKNPGNLNNEIGLPLTLLRMGPGYQRAVLEMGFYVPGEIAFLCELASPQVGVITNVGTVHAERAGSQEQIACGKAELIQSLPTAPDGIAILNYDDPWVRPMAELTKARVIFYGLDPNADIWADHIEGLGLQGIRFQMHYKKELLHIKVPLIGQHSVHTALRAAAVGIAEGLPWAEIILGLQEGHAQLRLVAVHTESGALILDDTYNASPESTLAALNLLDELEGKKIAVLGDMLELGPYEKQGHEMAGARAAEVASKLIAIGERSQIMVEAAKKAGMSSDRILWFPEAQQAIDVLVKTLEKGDVVLVKGSHGLRMDRIVTALEVEE
jgi:UDP-N-acetylmuramoyl-tripeptide--D-alanyl-D-alanine ligase